MKICIVGAGWYGCHIALILKKAGHDVTLVEKNDEIFKGVSADRGIRLHAGPHYPRSKETRKGCHINFQRFKLTYPELVVEHAYSIYGLGDKDADGASSKVSQREFDAVCQETTPNQMITAQKINPAEWGYQYLSSAFNINEPSIKGGKELRETFSRYLKEAGVKVLCNFNVNRLETTFDGINVTDGTMSEIFDYVINSTCFENLLPAKKLPFEMEAVYQPCLALVYRDKLKTTSELPFSFIVMDGMYPCMMPFDTRHNGPLATNEKGEAHRIYMLTHGKWTIMASCPTFAEAQMVLKQINNKFIETHIKPNCEEHMKQFWPEFEDRFEYLYWTGSVLAKLKTEKEFRGAFSFAEKQRPVAHVFPGKVGCIFNVADEIFKLIESKDIIERDGYQFVKNGVLHEALGEITEKPDPKDIRNTCQLQTYNDLIASNHELMRTSITGLQNTIGNNKHSMWSPPPKHLKTFFLPTKVNESSFTVQNNTL